MDLKAIIANAVLSVQETQIRPEKPRIRFRGQKVINTNKHDARGEAVEHIANMLKQHGVPIWGALPIAYQFADYLPEDMSTTYIPFDPNVYESMEHTTFYQRLNEEMLKFLHGVVTGSKPLPEKPENWDRYLYAVYENRNHKKEMEDKKIILPLMCVIEPSKDHTLKDASLFGVFDGHGGDECATYATVHLPHCLIDSLTENSSKLLTEALKDLDKQISVRAEHDRIGGGSTSVVALIREGIIDIAWIGDSAIGALTNDSVITLTKPHNLDDPKEVERVIAAGGMILNVFGEDRVNGVLNITRALGDTQARPMISAEPSDSRIDIKESGYYMIFLASDGVWDVLTEEEIFENVVSFIKNNPESEYEKLAQSVGNTARATSTDNLMLVIVFLKPLSEIWQHFTS
uniref:PPM-type phosphatase domain-containing protein n=1 Tax=Panagrolaimus sp. ES5 TaxID=591445 RepID=A0AC34FL78_9BILA